MQSINSSSAREINKRINPNSPVTRKGEELKQQLISIDAYMAIKEITGLK